MVWYKRLAESLLVGISLGIGFVVPALWWLSLVGVGYVVLLLEQGRLTIGRAWLIWIFKYLLALLWFWSVYPLDWLGVSLGSFELVAVGFYWVTAAVWLGSGGVLVYCLYTLLQKFLTRLRFVILPFVWLLGELFGALFFSVMTYGPGAAIGAKFSFGFVGYHLAQHDLLLQTAAVGGVYALTLVLVVLAVIGFVLVQRKCWILVGVLLLTACVSSVWSPTGTTPGQGVTVAVVDTDISATYRLTNQGQFAKEAIIDAAYDAVTDMSVEYAVFPEDSRVFDQSQGISNLEALLEFTTPSSSPMVIDSGSVSGAASSVLQGVIYDPVRTEAAIATKRYLVPQGEFMPTAYYWLLRLIGFRETAEYMKLNFSYTVGTESSQSHFRTEMPALLFCFESVDPTGVRSLLQDRTDAPLFVAHVVSHAWFHDARNLYPQLEAMLRTQAIWNKVYIVSAANQATGYTVTSNGTVIYPKPVSFGEGWQVGTITLPRDSN